MRASGAVELLEIPGVPRFPFEERLAQLLGGDVDVESKLGEGALFTLHVPMDFADAAVQTGLSGVKMPEGPTV